MGGPASATVLGDPLDEISVLAANGAGRLALRLMDRLQPGTRSSPDVWMQWERERSALYAARFDWKGLIERAAMRPPGLRTDFLRWSDTQVAHAFVELGDGAGARRVLLSLLWNTPVGGRSNHFPGWRRAIIRSYLIDGRIEDARLAGLRYRLDYGDEGEGWRELHAEVLFRSGQLEQVARLLSSPVSPRESLLALSVSRELRSLRVDDVQRQVEELLARDPDPRTELEAWDLLARVAQSANRDRAAAHALENALALAGASAGAHHLSADRLWDAYTRLAASQANANQLLVGRYQDWLALAQAVKAESPIDARALMAHVVLEGPGPLRDVAESELVSMLGNEPKGRRLLSQLYLSSMRAVDESGIPALVRYPLIEQALDDSDLRLATQLIRGLDDGGTSTRVLYARVLIHGESEARGIALIESLVGEPGELSARQSAGLHKAIREVRTALGAELEGELLEGLLKKVNDEGVGGEILLSIADARLEQRRYEEAARTYLRAAASAGATAGWAQRARYDAARALSLAGMGADARELYEQLRDEATDPGEKAFLSSAIERLGVE